MTGLCQEFGTSRVNGYQYLKQYAEFDIDGLKDKRRKMTTFNASTIIIDRMKD